eukprot:3097028-Amphidinium_carterae.1
MEGAISAHFMPDSSKRRIKRTAETILSAIGTAFKVPVALSTEAGFQASKIRAFGSHFRKQVFGRVPLDLVIGFAPSKVLGAAVPSTLSRYPGKSIS